MAVKVSLYIVSWTVMAWFVLYPDLFRLHRHRYTCLSFLHVFCIQGCHFRVFRAVMESFAPFPRLSWLLWHYIHDCHDLPDTVSSFVGLTGTVTRTVLISFCQSTKMKLRWSFGPVCWFICLLVCLLAALQEMAQMASSFYIQVWSDLEARQFNFGGHRASGKITGQGQILMVICQRWWKCVMRDTPCLWVQMTL